METGSGSRRIWTPRWSGCFPRRPIRAPARLGGSRGDHLLPVFVAPTLTLLVEDGRPVLGTWQSVVLIDPNRENDVRRVRLTYIAG